MVNAKKETKPKKLGISIFNTIDIKNGSFTPMDECIRNDVPDSYIPSGSFTLDYIIGRPGLRKNSSYVVVGPSGSTKSYLAGEFIRSITLYNQANFGEPGLILLYDAEQSYTPDWLELRKIPTGNIMTCDFDSLEAMRYYFTEFLPQYKKAIAPRIKDIPRPQIHKHVPILGIVIDTFSAVCSDADFDEKGQIAQAAQAISKVFRVFQRYTTELNIMVLSVFQEKSQFKRSPYEKDDLDKSARGIKPARFHSNITFKLSVQKKSETIRLCKIKGSKNRLNSLNEDKVTPVAVHLHNGIDDTEAIVAAAVEMGIAKKIGSNYIIDDTQTKYPPEVACERVWEKVKAEMFGPDYNPYVYTGNRFGLKLDGVHFIDANEEEEDELTANLDPELLR